MYNFKCQPRMPRARGYRGPPSRRGKKSGWEGRGGLGWVGLGWVVSGGVGWGGVGWWRGGGGGKGFFVAKWANLCSN